MFIVILKFSSNKAKAGEFMNAHNEWIKTNVENGHFLLVGSIQPKAGGAIIANGMGLKEISTIVDMDPFVLENVVEPEIIEVKPGVTTERLSFLKD